MASALLSAPVSLSIHNLISTSSTKTYANPRVSIPNSAPARSVFATGSPLLNPRIYNGRNSVSRKASLSVRCEQNTQEGSGLDVWLGRVAMIGFAAAITVEVSTGKGLLENFGLADPLPTVALAVTALVGVLTAVFIFQSSSKN